MTPKLASDVVIEAPDYVQNQADSIAALSNELAKDQAKKTEERDPEIESKIAAQIDELSKKPTPTVRYWSTIQLHCSGKRCPSPDFTASFPEVQRLIPCPACGREVEVPESYRGMP